jgi:hypothetical protein
VGFVISGAGEWSWAGSRGDMDRRGQHRPAVVEVVAEELGPSLRWATATPTNIAKRDGG